ncbi:hypothetical protein L873DRAFT_1818019 [Choiromyces venosus 120613-1]|uniref:Uncharacterized protein n=1 Tax=Choiromyces venosus 120613-1 TaxID=1336337 RepID=A0A3N4J713_9PEZI|nr:hypothetical protein L873DRAFT_1818019 [Choiromyces venosus 120613-1]
MRELHAISRSIDERLSPLPECYGTSSCSSGQLPVSKAQPLNPPFYFLIPPPLSHLSSHFSSHFSLHFSPNLRESYHQHSIFEPLQMAIPHYFT